MHIKSKRAIPWLVIVPLRPSPLGAPWTLNHSEDATPDAADKTNIVLFFFF